MSDEPKYIRELRALANRKTVALNEGLAYIDSLRARVEELEIVCAEAYQVVGALASYAGVFCTDDVERALDNLAQRKRVHSDLLPWPKNDAPFLALENTVKRAEQLYKALARQTPSTARAGREVSKEDIVYRLRERARIRRQIPNRKSVQEGKPDRLADLLDEAANEIDYLRLT